MSPEVAACTRAKALGLGALLAALVGRPAVAVAAAEPGGASEGTAALRWRAPESCPDEATVAARLARALPPEVEPPRVEADVRPGDDGRFHATVVLRGAWGETRRSLDSPTCDTLADAVVLLAVVSVSAAGEPEPPALAVPEPTPPEPAPGPTVEPTPSPDLARVEPVPSLEGDAEPTPATPELADRGAADRSRAPEAASGPALRGLARLEARAGAGLLPTVDLGAAATLGLAHRWFRVELSGAAWLPRERTVAPEARVRASAWALELRGCAALRPRPWLTVLPCVELDAGGLRGEGRGEGLASGRALTQPWVAIGLGPAVSVRLHRLVGLWLGATAVVPVRRVGLGIEGLPGDVEAHRMAPIAGRGALGFEVHFP